MANIFNNIFAPKIANQPKKNNNSVNVKTNVANLFASNSSVNKQQVNTAPTSELSNLMNQINNLNEKIIANNKEIEQKDKLNEQLQNENKVLKANLQSIMRHYNLRFN